jgi:hypothetical protein
LKEIGEAWCHFQKFLDELTWNFDKNLTWKYHISHVASKISRTIGILARLHHFIPLSALLNIYNTLIYTFLSYGLCVWGQASKTHLNKIFILQKRDLCLMYFMSYRAHTIPAFVSSKIIPLNMLYFKSCSYDLNA